MSALLAEARSSRAWLVALITVLVVAAFQVLTAFDALRSGIDEDIRASFVVWSGFPALFAVAVLVIARRGKAVASFTHIWLCAVATGAALVYVWAYWLGGEAKDPAFIFIFAPLFQSGAYLVGGSFGLVLAAILRSDPSVETR